MPLSIRQVTFDELYNDKDFKALEKENETENAIKDLPPIKLKVDLYRQLEKANGIHITGVYLDTKLVGFAALLYPVMPHFSELIAVCESLFVAKSARNSGAGLKLIKYCEEKAKSMKSPGLFFSAPLGGALAELLPHLEYKETTRVFLRTFKDEKCSDSI